MYIPMYHRLKTPNYSVLPSGQLSDYCAPFFVFACCYSMCVRVFEKASHQLFNAGVYLMVEDVELSGGSMEVGEKQVSHF